ncbi:hypothetical protein KC963_04005 [Candidatus Saccharibacteria bacterium]|nr:hypothetical protein [Candidatus Saccharibacteria bacterium]
MLKITLNQACTDTSLAILQRDQLLFGANGGVLSLFDIANSYCYDQTTAVANAKAVNNINESGNNGSLVIPSGQTVTIGGNGVVFDAVTASNVYVKGNAAAASNLWGAGAGSQYFLYCMYVRLPTLANWNSSGVLEAMMQFAADTASYQTVADLLLIAEVTGGSLSFRRQKAAASTDNLTITPVSGDYGTVVQLAFWRNASGQTARLKSANGTISATAAVGTANTQDFSACTEKAGHAGTFTGSANAVKWRFYRSFIENLVTSGRDPATVLDADYARTVARGVFS